MLVALWIDHLNEEELHCQPLPEEIDALLSLLIQEFES